MVYSVKNLTLTGVHYENTQITDNFEEANLSHGTVQFVSIDQLRKAALSTLKYVFSKKLLSEVGQRDQLEASLLKGIVLISKVISENNLTTDTLTSNEKTILDNLNALANNGYSDSDLANRYCNFITTELDKFNQDSNTLQSIPTTGDSEEFKKLVDFLNSL